MCGRSVRVEEEAEMWGKGELELWFTTFFDNPSSGKLPDDDTLVLSTPPLC